MQRNADAEIRRAVAVGMTSSERRDAVHTVIELMEDAEDGVRDWSTFVIGTQSELDTPEIRNALRKRLSDPFDEARAEAVWGLARRKDPEGLRLLIDMLESGDR